VVGGPHYGGSSGAGGPGRSAGAGTGGKGERAAREVRHSSLRRIGEVVAPALERLAAGDQGRAYAAWARAAGGQVASGARPRAFARGVLTVECTSSVWANELTYLGQEILRRMDVVAPGHPVVKLRFMVASAPPMQEREESPAKSEYRHARPEPQDYGAALEHAEEVRDERLRAVIEAVLKPADTGSDQTPPERTSRG
jgi:hypothetical protein